MRQARKRSLKRRAPYQVGFSISLGVFLSLVALCVFERIYFLPNLVAFSAHDALEMRTVLFGEPDTLGPWEIAGILLAGLLSVQVWAIWRKRRLRIAWRELMLVSVNFSMIGLLSFVFLSSWAFYYADEPGASHINRVARHFDIDFPLPDVSFTYERFPASDGWVKTGPYTHINESLDLVVKEELICKDLPLEVQIANHEARRTGKMISSLYEGRRADHYYDLDGNLLTIYASPIFPRVGQKLDAAGLEPWDRQDKVYKRFKKLRDAYPPPRPFTYEEILEMVEASWEGIDLYSDQDSDPINSSPE